jgi:hypothetical protein
MISDERRAAGEVLLIKLASPAPGTFHHDFLASYFVASLYTGDSV